MDVLCRAVMLDGDRWRNGFLFRVMIYPLRHRSWIAQQLGRQPEPQSVAKPSLFVIATTTISPEVVGSLVLPQQPDSIWLERILFYKSQTRNLFVGGR